ncbi:glycosyltransferase family 4 protein [Spirulina sp. CS-785/01]|uniref:glycosyltransferase family 4 protein n=1 Tax=Spirulina sp. CS-785/01 TaxID=3021716 RepID=UPI0023305AA4|nr:glycosyltransferase family 4 protein [Spirulina sp. CS-785/01]MDB9311708.1 glycosyltransferase family 4 protein [Spirulina sp. CS-785/01]
MRILLYSYNYYPEPIGIAPLMTELAEGLVQRGHEVRVVTAMPWYPKSEIYEPYRGKLYCTEERNGVKIQRCYVRSRPQRSLFNRALFELSFMVLSFFQALRGRRPDLIFLTVPGLPVGVPASILGFLYRCPIVLNLQDILPDAAVHVGLITNQLAIKIFSALEQYNYRTATNIAVISEGFTENLLSKNISEDKITLIPNWVNVDFIKPLPREHNYFCQENHLAGKFVVIYSGNIALTQGLETVIDAATYLQEVPQIAIVIVGEEKALQRLENYCSKKGAMNVILRPFQPREKLPEMLSAADVGLVVQKKNVIAFNMPSKIQVLLASGRAIIGSVPDSGTAARAIRASGGGVVVPPEDARSLAAAIQDLYEHPEQVKQLGNASRQQAIKNYSFTSALDRYEALFKRLLRSH